MSRQTLLLVDSDSPSRQLMELGLRQAGLPPTTCETVAEALAIADKGPPQLVVASVELTGGADGFALVAALRARASTAAVPVLLLSADADPALQQRALEVGAAGLLVKPVYIKELVTRLRRALTPATPAPATEKPAGPPPLPTAGRMGSGGLDELFARLSAQGITGALECAHPDRLSGQLWFESGRLVDAALGGLSGEPAARRLLAWHTGLWRFAEGRHARPATLSTTLSDLTAAVRDESQFLASQLERFGGAAAAPSVDLLTLAFRHGELDEELGAVLRLVDGRRTLARIFDASPLDGISTLSAVEKLVADGLVRPGRAASPPQARAANRSAARARSAAESAAAPPPSVIIAPDATLPVLPALEADDGSTTSPEISPIDLGTPSDLPTWNFTQLLEADGPSALAQQDQSALVPVVRYPPKRSTPREPAQSITTAAPIVSVDAPAVVEPIVTEPIVTEPIVDAPVAVEPLVTEPVVDASAAVEPLVTEPVVDAPAAVEPVVTQPVVTEPEQTPVERPLESAAPEPAPAAAENFFPWPVEPSPAVEPIEALSRTEESPSAESLPESPGYVSLPEEDELALLKGTRSKGPLAALLLLLVGGAAAAYLLLSGGEEAPAFDDTAPAAPAASLTPAPVTAAAEAVDAGQEPDAGGAESADAWGGDETSDAGEALDAGTSDAGDAGASLDAGDTAAASNLPPKPALAAPLAPAAKPTGALPAGALPAGALPAGALPAGALPAGALPAKPGATTKPAALPGKPGPPPPAMANEFDKAMAEGLLAARTSKWAKAIPLLQKGLKGRPDATALRELGKAFYNTSKAAKAVDELQSAAKLNDRDPETYLYLGMALSDLDRLEEARRAYKRFLVIEPTGARAKEITAVLENMGR